MPSGQCHEARCSRAGGTHRWARARSRIVRAAMAASLVMTAANVPQKPRNQRPGMQYRRFGRTNLPLSVITLGGMRYHDGWSAPHDQPSARMIEQCAEMVRMALAAGVNHIE